MMTQVKNQNFQRLKLTVYSEFLVLILAGSSIGVLKATEEENSEMLPIATLQPKYPALALSEEKEGWVLLEFIVDREGNVINPAIVDSCINSKARPQRKELSANLERNRDSGVDNCLNDDIFDSSSLAAIAQFKFKPRRVNGVYADVPGIRYLFSYNISK